MDETGALNEPSQPIFAVGLLVVRDVATLTNRLHTVSLNLNARLREKRLALQRQVTQLQDGQMMLKDFQLLLAKSRHHEYKFTELREHNLNDYMAILNEFLAVPGSEFHAIVVHQNAETRARLGGVAWPTYVMVTKTLLRRRLREPSFVCCDWQTKPKNLSLSLEDELQALPHVAGCLRMTSDTSAFLQVTDLLLGVVSFDWREANGWITQSKNSALKRDLSTFVKAKLRLAPSTRFLGDGRCYFIRTKPIRFTVWEPRLASLERAPKRRARGMLRGQSRSTG